MSVYSAIPLRRLMKLAEDPEIFGVRELASLARSQARDYAKANPSSGMRVGTQPFMDDASAQKFLANNPRFAEQARTRISDAGGFVSAQGRMTAPHPTPVKVPAAPAAAPSGGNPVSSRSWSPLDVAEFARGYARQAGLPTGSKPFATEDAANKFLANNPNLARRAMQDFKNTPVTTASGAPFQLPAAAQRAPTAVASKGPAAPAAAPDFLGTMRAGIAAVANKPLLSPEAEAALNEPRPMFGAGLGSTGQGPGQNAAPTAVAAAPKPPVQLPAAPTPAATPPAVTQAPQPPAPQAPQPPAPQGPTMAAAPAPKPGVGTGAPGGLPANATNVNTTSFGQGMGRTTSTTFNTPGGKGQMTESGNMSAAERQQFMDQKAKADALRRANQGRGQAGAASNAANAFDDMDSAFGQ